ACRQGEGSGTARPLAFDQPDASGAALDANATLAVANSSAEAMALEIVRRHREIAIDATAARLDVDVGAECGRETERHGAGSRIDSQVVDRREHFDIDAATAGIEINARRFDASDADAARADTGLESFRIDVACADRPRPCVHVQRAAGDAIHRDSARP